MKRSTIRLLPMLGAALLGTVACHEPKPANETPTPSEQSSRPARAVEGPETTRRHWDYLNRIRQRDALSASIERTLLNDQNELGVVLFPSVTPDKVPAFLHQVMAEMAHEFPKEDLTLSAYAASSRPRKIGTAYLNGQTGETIYTPVQ